MITTNELREKFINFFESKGHAIIPSASLIPENDPSVLFTMAGMHPLVPYLIGEKHPAGKRLVGAQKCIRTGDIDDVGDNRHLTFFEMLGNWSLGDFFKEEAIAWSFEFLTSKEGLGLDANRLYVTVFRGNEEAPIDEESIKIWQKQFKKAGIEVNVSESGKWENENTRIFALEKDDNWWGLPAGGPCGPCSEMFYDVSPEKGFEKNKTHAELVGSARFVEVWNDVFMEYDRQPNGSLIRLKHKSVDTGFGLERTTAILNGQKEVFDIDEFKILFDKISELSGKKYVGNERAFRIIADHLRAATFILGDDRGIEPLNVGAGYVLRRLIRRAVRYGKQLGIEENFTFKIAEVVIKSMVNVYPELKKNKEFIVNQLIKEEEKFKETLENGLHEFEKLSRKKLLSGKEAFVLFSSYGFPFEITNELAKEKGIEISKTEFDEEFAKHQELSRTASVGMFKGGLADSSEETKRLHTAAHLLLAALRHILGDDIYQKGSNINAERLRFDFNYPEKLTAEQIERIEALVNEKIQECLPIKMKEMPKEKALKTVKISFDPSKYGDTVKVYSMGDFSKELCGGSHAKNTGDLGWFKIVKEEASSAGVRRIKAMFQ
jgi:alanyl-tRNA synthetase